MAAPDTNFLSGTAKPGPYKTTLSLPDELEFQQWVKKNHVPFDDSPTSDYDMRGFYKAQKSGDPAAQTAVSAFDGKMHFPDTYKTPYHQSFSRESIYATPNAPQWNGDQLQNRIGTTLVDERPKPQPAFRQRYGQ